MTDLELKVTVHVRFYDGGHECPLTGENYVVYLYDRDLFEDDYLGYSYLNEKGEATILFDTGAIKSIDSPLENYPDLYCVLCRNGRTVFQTNIVKDLDLEQYSYFDTRHGWHVNLGTFLVKEKTEH